MIFASDTMLVSLIGYIPYFGKAMNFVLLSLMYAYYCFDYTHVNAIQHSFNYLFLALCIYRFDLYFYTLNFATTKIARYKWNFFAVNVNKRLDFFESNWAFFAGFGMFTFYHLLE
jgi:etoposide-induced 2.4 mRNA